jgi:PAS domain S-box-containing protein
MLGMISRYLSQVIRQKKYEEKLLEFGQVAEQSTSMICVTDELGQVTFINKMFTEILGYSFEEVGGKRNNFIAASEDAIRKSDELRSAISMNKPWQDDIEVLAKDGKVIWARANVSPLFMHGTLTNIVITFEDITYQKQIEKELKQNYELYKTLIDNLPLLVLIVNYDGKVLFVNDRPAAIDASAEEIMNRTIIDLFPEPTARQSLINIRWVFENKQSLAGERLMEWKGKLINFSIQRFPIFNEKKDVNSVMIIMQNITEKKRIEKMMQIQHQIDSLSSITESLEESLRIIFKYLMEIDWVSACGIFLLNAMKNKIDLVSYAGVSKKFARNIASYPKDSTIFQILTKKRPRYITTSQLHESSKPFMEKEGFRSTANIPLIHNDEVIGSLYLASKESEVVGKNDRLIVESIAARLANLIILIQTQEKLIRMNKKLSLNLKELREKQQLLIQKSKLESLGELSAGMAHEINQPLSVITLALENIISKSKRQIPDQEYLDNKFEIISRNIEKIREIIDHVRIFSRDQGKILLERVEVNTVIKNSLSLINEQFKNHRIQIGVNLKKEIGFTVGNSFRLEQVMLNLLSNSRYAIEEKEKLGVAGDSLKISIRTWNRSKRIFIEVKDSGIGIPQENMDKLFNPFFTTKPEGLGTGLGLPIVYGIITEMNGEINIESVAGEFTTVTIRLPEY